MVRIPPRPNPAPYAAADDRLRHIVEAFHRQGVDAMKGGQRQAVRNAQLHQEAPGIDLDRVVGAG